MVSSVFLIDFFPLFFHISLGQQSLSNWGSNASSKFQENALINMQWVIMWRSCKPDLSNDAPKQVHVLSSISTTSYFLLKNKISNLVHTFSRCLFYFLSFWKTVSLTNDHSRKYDFFDHFWMERGKPAPSSASPSRVCCSQAHRRNYTSFCAPIREVNRCQAVHTLTEYSKYRADSVYGAETEWGQDHG